MKSSIINRWNSSFRDNFIPLIVTECLTYLNKNDEVSWKTKWLLLIKQIKSSVWRGFQTCDCRWLYNWVVGASSFEESLFQFSNIGTKKLERWKSCQNNDTEDKKWCAQSLAQFITFRNRILVVKYQLCFKVSCVSSAIIQTKFISSPNVLSAFTSKVGLCFWQILSKSVE